MVKSPAKNPARKNRASAPAAPAPAGPPRITVDELFAKLGDPKVTEADLRPYFELDKARSGPFLPELKLDETRVAVPKTEEGLARGDMLLASANWWSRMRRAMRFNRTMASGYSGPIIVSEGDSWFQYPILVDDTVDHLLDNHHYAVRSLDAAGDTLQNMLASGEYLDALRQTGASVFMFSGGGNDVLGGGHLADLLRDYDPALTPAAHILPAFSTQLDEAIAAYDAIIRSVERLPGDVLILCHGYDWPIPNNGPWLGRPMAKRDIKDPAVQRAIVAEMINRFNTRLARLLSGFGNARYLDLRGLIGASPRDWHDELHPTSRTFAKVADRFDTLIRANAPPFVASRSGRSGRSAPTARPSLAEASVSARARSRPRRPPASTGRRGHSLHVGLNEFSEAHYGYKGELNACHRDAQAMRDIALAAGFENPEVLLDAQATRDAVIGRIAEAARTLKAGDIFLYTYAGHGSQLPDFNDDEEDSLDETWCLFDGMMLDDEALDLWSQFREGVRILVISDSCHSGTMLRAPARAASDTGADGAPADFVPKERLLSELVAYATYSRHQEFYRSIGERAAGDGPGRAMEDAATRLIRPVVRASVRLISGCQDEQVSMDGFFNGRFTAELLKVWKAGRFEGGYDAFHRAIVAGMPATQRPNHFFIGVPDAAFDAQKPFTI